MKMGFANEAAATKTLSKQHLWKQLKWNFKFGSDQVLKKILTFKPNIERKNFTR